MKSILKAFRLTLVFCVFLSVTYISVLWLFAKVAGPNGGNAEVEALILIPPLRHFVTIG